MTARRTSHSKACVFIAWLAFHVATATAANDETLARAKDLYLSAAYDEALAVLNTLQTDSAAGGASEVAQYRMFCLLALDRQDEARKAIEGIVNADPFYRPSEAQTSPRIRGVFQDIRRAILPSVVQRAYAEAKDAFERKDPQASAQFDRLLSLLDDPDVRTNTGLADLRTVAAGFRDLSKAVASTAAAAAAAPPPASAPGANRTDASAPNAVVPARDGDAGVLPPVTISQRLPQWTPFRESDRLKEFSGTIEVTIDEQGNVAAAAIRESVHPTYDSELLRAARAWKYKPATKNGAPTKYIKLVEVQLRPPQG